VHLPKPAIRDHSPESSLDTLLASALERAMLLTGAHGAAIGLDDSAGMLCRASVGEIAPPVGSPVDSRSGLTGECLKTGSVLWCRSTDSDPFIDRDSCLKMGIGSVIAVPVLGNGGVIGLIEVFSRQAYAFDASDCYGLETIAKAVAASVGGTWVVEPGRDDQNADRNEIGLRATPAPGDPVMRSIAPAVPETVITSSTTATDDRSSVSARTLLPEGYKFSLREKIVLHERPILWSAAAALLAACLWLTGIPRFRKTSARETVIGSQIPPLGASPRASKSVTVSARASSPASWLEDLPQRAERGDPNAELKLGAAYANGQNGAANYPESVKWLTRSAEHGNVTAAAVLGAFDWAGRGGNQGYIDAYTWSAIAQAEGDEASGYRVAILESRMSPAQLAEAKRRAADWLRAHRKAKVMKPVTTTGR